MKKQTLLRRREILSTIVAALRKEINRTDEKIEKQGGIKRDHRQGWRENQQSHIT